ncbi:Cytochrome bd-I oxidase subunit I [Streptomyces venezuelae]|uniref:cytochrome ubiquinol oxidase subunit I n=1 Tax=Streptomyces gardneri TaxID=66892 RepID=UPI0006BDB495|nr:cytochrome ubiquinol oxidase subunit I [Streptomyces gardneri]ALO12886.1 Cytochrome bd-I oxidase subunit I [Streptomyces venezuelae]QPK49591.1 cytochrome ubiquinol oxidase subunit I [Streptomyces gardneri]WRK41135.1 cytochrome ubiquinol oxidase subunit I [Streptomyces venezuelae]CUM36456.1 Cytochrome d ubiquinol oxidase subunit I [Streptomyces venezuelae]
MPTSFHLLADAPAQLLPARELMAFTLASHIILVPLGVAFPFITLVMHYRGLRRKDATALLLARRWSAVMAVQFALGIVTGTVLSFEFGLLWPGLMGRWGDVFGIGFGVEAWAFFLEAVLIAIYLYGWRRLKPRTHFLLGLPLPAAALLGAFGILAANSWMNTPQGFSLDSEGNPVDVNVWKAIFTPMFGPQYWHFVVAMIITAGFMVSGVYAVGWLRGRRDHYHRLGFAVPFTIAAVATPVQFVLGDSIARSVFHKQPVKFAALEIVWETDTRVPEYLFGRLQENGTVKGGIKIPLLDSILAGFSPDTKVVGLTSVPADQRPTATQATIAHWAFDIMVLIGSVLVLLALWYGLVWLRHRRLPASKWFYRSAACAGVASVVAVESGWIATEVGRQPWIVYQNMRVAEAVTSTRSTTLWIMLAVVMVVYVFLFGSFLVILLKMRTRWRLADEQQAAGGPSPHAPETDTPYGPRAPVPAGDAPAADGGAAGAEGGRR